MLQKREVPVMLSLISPNDATCMGTWLGGGSTPVPCDLADRQLVLPVPDGAQGTGMPFARPQARKADYLPGFGAQAGSQAESAPQQHDSNAQIAYTKTRIAARFIAKGGGHLGSHPPREPV
jgi:hypothetical protein